mmetsp:Transcript_1707/g.3697  ORF Transcript_1707/g.3697 Transcript_1707/m.3697 type:complete len:92 (+) Transcript_1707:525-800(+)
MQKWWKRKANVESKGSVLVLSIVSESLATSWCLSITDDSFVLTRDGFAGHSNRELHFLVLSEVRFGEPELVLVKWCQEGRILAGFPLLEWK